MLKSTNYTLSYERQKYSGKITLEYSRRNNMEITSYDKNILEK